MPKEFRFHADGRRILPLPRVPEADLCLSSGTGKEGESFMAITATFIRRTVPLHEVIIDDDLTMIDDYTGVPRRVITREVIPPNV